jgi:RHS repeat-associated protein
MPFGEELYTGIGARSASLNYGTNQDGIRQKFTGYQKDNETGLDFAEARMYENRHGRFTAVDPLLASGKSPNPQSFNRFIYVGNRPLTLTDPTGLDWYSMTVNDVTSYRWSSNNETFDDDGSSISGWALFKFPQYGDYYYDGCANDDCSVKRRAVLYRQGDWNWLDSVAHLLRDYWQAQKSALYESYRDIKEEFTNGFRHTREDIDKITRDPLGPYGLGNPHLGMATGGAASGFQGVSRIGTLFSRSARTVDVGADTVSGISKTIQFEQYSLRAARDGMYPVMQRGFKEPVGDIFLRKGDVWKFGETMNPATRYSGTFLRNTGEGLIFKPEFKTSSFKEVLQLERQQIIQYEQIFGTLPPGNKIRR